MNKDRITVVMVSDSREPVTVEFSVKELVLAAALVLCLAGAAVFSVLSFNRLQDQHRQLADSAETLRRELMSRESRIDSLRERIEQRRGAVMVIGASGDTMEVSPGSYSDLVSVEDLRVSAVDSLLDVSFRLVNNSETELAASGYLVVLAEHASGDMERYGTFPDIRIQPGNALAYNSGDSYTIRRYKEVEAAIPLADKPDRYQRLKVLVFDQQGGLLQYQDLKLNIGQPD